MKRVNLIGLVAKYNHVNFATAKEMIEEEFFPPERYYSATKVTKGYLDCLNIPEEEQAQVFDKIEKKFAIEIEKQFSGCPNWYGIEGIYFKWHGAWADPEIEYKGHAMSMHTIEDAFVSMYEEECEEKEINPDYGVAFGKFMQGHEDTIKEWMLCDGNVEY